MSLFTKDIQEHLAPAPFDRAARITHPGMAHFAGSGPALKTCRECEFWGGPQPDYRSKNGKWRGLIKPARCRKYRALTGAIGDEIPDDAAACRHFEESEKIPPRFDRT